jgi:hypothetical protein
MTARVARYPEVDDVGALQTAQAGRAASCVREDTNECRKHVSQRDENRQRGTRAKSTIWKHTSSQEDTPARTQGITNERISQHSRARAWQAGGREQRKRSAGGNSKQVGTDKSKQPTAS